MYLQINFVFLIFIILLQSYVVNSNKDSKLKSATIDAIVEKICNITLNSLTNKSSEEKSLILSDIEEKLKKSVIGSGVEGHKYVKFIMHGIKLIAFNNSKHIESKNGSAMIVMTAHNVETTSDEKKTKEQAIHNIAIKIEKLAMKYMNDAETPESKQAVMDKIKKKVMDAANRRHMMIHDKHKEIKSYSNIIAKGIDLMMKKNVPNDTRRRSLNDDNETHKGVHLKIVHAATKTKKLTTTQDLSEAEQCDKILKEICTNTKSLNNLICRYDKNQFTLEKMCDGTPDCPDESDERDCAEQAINKIKNAGRIMSQIESAMSRACISASSDKEMLSQKNLVLRGVLESQLKFIEKYTHRPIAEFVNRRKNEINKNVIKNTTHEVALVISSLAMALDGSLCAKRIDIDESIAKYGGDTAADEPLDWIVRRISLAMASCNCNGLTCANSTCSVVCARVCWQRFALNRWPCRAVDEGPSVSLDALCDGKLDCYDETDEIGCALGSSRKFEAGKLYDSVLKLISSKIKLEEYHFVLTHLVTLLDSIIFLQKFSFQPNLENMNVKIVREQCFTSIKEIHEEFLNKNNINRLNIGYQFLSSVSEMLMNAMKLSKTGNDKIILPGKCLCTGALCAMPMCSKLCLRACSAEPTLTRYTCRDVEPNHNIPIHFVCNGKNDCPKKEDEKECLKDVCRTHHLVVLRHKLKDIGVKEEGSALGEVLKAWKSKVISLIMIAEKEGRPTPNVIKDVISRVLQDLVMSYASLKVSRRNNESNVLKQFITISQTIMESIKSCGQ